MKIVGWLPTSLLEWPGQIAAVIFTPGCNLRCPFCHNPEVVNWQPGDSPLVESEIVLTNLSKRTDWIDGLVISGGEPTLQPDLADFLSQVKKIGLKVMVETNGTCPEIIQSLIEKKLVNFWALDYKLSWGHYDRLGFEGAGQKAIRSCKLILASGQPWELRTTVVPTLHRQSELISMACWLKKEIGKKPAQQINWRLQSFRPQHCLDPDYEKLSPMITGQETELLSSVKKVISSVTWKGLADE